MNQPVQETEQTELGEEVMSMASLRSLVADIIQKALELLAAAMTEPTLVDLHGDTIQGFVDSLKATLQQSVGSPGVSPQVVQEIIRISSHLQEISKAVMRYQVAKHRTDSEALASAIHDTYYLQQDPTTESAQLLLQRVRNAILHIRTTQSGYMTMPLQLVDLCTTLADRGKFPELLEVLQRLIAGTVQAGIEYTKLMQELQQPEEPTPEG